MKIFRKVGIAWLVFLLSYCSFLLFTILFICQFGASAFIYFKEGQFPFSWSEALYIAFKKGCVAGLILGTGLWIKAKIQEQKDKKSSSK